MSAKIRNSSGPRILLLATCDTKMEEIAFIHNRLTTINPKSTPILLDIGRNSVSNDLISIHQQEVLSTVKEPSNFRTDLASLSRDEHSTLMIEAATSFVRDLHRTSPLHGVLGIGGSTGSSVIASIMREAVPVGLPKLLVSTMASGDVGPLVGGVDLTLMYSVTDIAGLNFLSRRVLGNAAAAMVGMAGAAFHDDNDDQGDSTEQGCNGNRKKKRIAITMFGVTTPGVDAIRALLAQPPYDAEVIVFHATGSGGRAMEALVRQGELDAVIDLTTTEIADEVGGGVLSAGPSRLEAAGAAGIPLLVSVGACDMINFGPRGTIPRDILDAVEAGERRMHVHNPMVTLLRTTPEENRRIAEFVVGKLRRARRRDLVKVLIPAAAVSMISGKGDPFEDREADAELFQGIEEGLRGSQIEVLRFDDLGINDGEFAEAVIEVLAKLQEQTAV